MKLTVVTFRAYDKPHQLGFVDKTPEQIHATLSDICRTYEPMDILTAEGAIFLPLSTLNTLRNATVSNQSEAAQPTH